MSLALITPNYGYCQKGQRFYALKSGKKTQRISMVAALSGRKIVVPLTFEGHCNMDVFNGWFEQFLTPILEPGQTDLTQKKWRERKEFFRVK
ncbi:MULTISPECIES: transposase [Wolbachia]|uniref:transposase n=1 Tax=Wolbachia TaxID=953 RepID=UPI0000DAED35|nr:MULTISPECIES: transposase [Wolbachia]CAI5594515.1 hypothetical protein WMELPLUS_00903 [Wolbachia endosymbiont of Drosophila melanogaster]CAI5617369.1 hypothetical protein WMELCS112_00905 [Wolbachia endosymbiont of Drosophila melanogaster]CDR79237.1 Putative transposase [Wolbachia endosymbiont of Drosophila simulans wAu]